MSFDPVLNAYQDAILDTSKTSVAIDHAIDKTEQEVDELLAMTNDFNSDINVANPYEVEDRIAAAARLHQRNSWDLCLNISNLYASELPSSFSTIAPSLQRLKMTDNYFVCLPDNLTDAPNLKDLDISMNPITALGPVALALTTLQSLTANELHDAKLIPTFTNLSPELTELTTLTSLSLRKNNLTEFPTQISKLSNLRVLDLSNNNFDSISFDFTTLPNLSHLVLDKCGIKSPLPESLGASSNLKQVSLINNRLTSIPVSLWRRATKSPIQCVVQLETNSKSVQEILRNSAPSDEIFDVDPPNEQSKDPQPIESPHVQPQDDYHNIQDVAGVKSDNLSSPPVNIPAEITQEPPMTEQTPPASDRVQVPEAIAQISPPEFNLSECRIEVEYCINCERHLMTTRHVIGSYEGYYESLKREIGRYYPDLDVLPAPVMGSKRDSPRIGSFEVFFVRIVGNGSFRKEIYSKLKTRRFPTISTVLGSLDRYINERNTEAGAE
eukprot:TRINITY_DN6777_c0_g1_i8.p1 TRINITY_DN6777_c0_g1~~TRINITY_DN6777_c0_g1_i8.p1  ORF type:complete len:497 (-),score=102.58 TRINITY_DN6777_c0_g1_i8:160-1650(-)